MLTLAIASVIVVSSTRGASYADAIVQYSAGAGFATDWNTGRGITNPASALGMPSVQTVDPDPVWGGTFPVTPFSPAYLGSQVVSLGTNGSLTVRFDAPVRNAPGHLHGLDFIIYGNAGFMDVDWPNGMTDESASLLGHNTGSSRVSVSVDGLNFFQLNPALAPSVDRWYPTDGQGMFGLPVDPALIPSTFANRTLAQIRSLYGGSAGGAAFDLAWAVDGGGQPVSLDSARFVRIEILDGVAEIDGLVAVPEPGLWTVLGFAGILALACKRRR